MTFRVETLTDTLLSRLNEILEPLKVGDGEAPKPTDGAARPSIPYYVLTRIPGGTKTGGPLGDNPQGIATWTYQLTAVGEFRGQVEFAIDKADAALLDRSLGKFTNAFVLPAGEIVDRRFDSDGPTVREADVWNASRRFAIMTSS